MKILANDPNMNRLFNNLLKPLDDLDFDGGRVRSSPKVRTNILETKEEYEIEMEAPGFTKADFSIDLNGKSLSIKTKMNEEASKPGNYIQQQFERKSFERRFLVPLEKVNVEALTASYEGGILIVRLAKKAEEKETPKTSIRVE